MPNNNDFSFSEMNIINNSLPLWSHSDNLGTIENRLSEEKKRVHNLCILTTGRDLPMGSASNNLHLGLCEGWKVKHLSGAADTAGTQDAAKGDRAGAQGWDEEINNPLIIQNREWLWAIGKRFSNYLINC
jgi:hypothetical protein